jgi:hypothetical protein
MESGFRSLNNLTINKSGTASTLTLLNNLDVATSLTFGGTSTMKINTGAFQIDLGQTGAVAGESNAAYLTGTLVASRTLNNGSSTFGNLGASVSGCNTCNMGLTTVTRINGANSYVTGIGGTQSINRRFKIEPTIEPASPVNLTLAWLSADDNYSSPGTMGRVWKSTDNGVTWLRVGNQATFTNRSISVTTSTFSDWTVSDNNNVLPVELTKFSVSLKDNRPFLNWTTAVEKNASKFVI